MGGPEKMAKLIDANEHAKAVQGIVGIFGNAVNSYSI